MLLITKNNLGNIFVSSEVIKKKIITNFSKNKFNIKILNLTSYIVNSFFFIEIEISLSNKIDNKFLNINNYIYDFFKKNLINNFNLFPKNISIIYKHI